MTENAEMLIAFIALAVINAAVCIAIARSGYYERGQVVAQAAIVWLVPVIGAILMGVFLRVQRETSTFDTRAYPERAEEAVPLELDGSSHSHDQ